jgi:hypothetical protein
VQKPIQNDKNGLVLDTESERERETERTMVRAKGTLNRDFKKQLRSLM